MTPRQRHANRVATQERLVVTMQKKARTGETLVWTERAVPVMTR